MTLSAPPGSWLTVLTGCCANWFADNPVDGVVPPVLLRPRSCRAPSLPTNLPRDRAKKEYNDP